ncbi:hypothetical protein BCV70DRAFT_202717 [Testicularia cyperi]|uniref:Uncharacterized protein n=1 Tax=Testicularia cyperi TaxID=1882483 RepID=A0A317XHK6_9BASI|nr:hypothetical protein BCV70DRAFT_202717 [Testicularia cyperi]
MYDSCVELRTGQLQTRFDSRSFGVVRPSLFAATVSSASLLAGSDPILQRVHRSSGDRQRATGEHSTHATE